MPLAKAGTGGGGRPALIRSIDDMMWVNSSSVAPKACLFQCTWSRAAQQFFSPWIQIGGNQANPETLFGGSRSTSILGGRWHYWALVGHRCRVHRCDCWDCQPPDMLLLHGSSSFPRHYQGDSFSRHHGILCHRDGGRPKAHGIENLSATVSSMNPYRTLPIVGTSESTLFMDTALA
jgi:hypothetical protein